MDKAFEIFTLITGVIYMILEIRQKNFMWVVGILTSLAAMYVFFCQGVYASFGLNTYYLVTSFIGLWHWRRDKDILQADGDDSVHLNRLTRFSVLSGALITVVGVIGLTWGMELLSRIGLKENPMSSFVCIGAGMMIVYLVIDLVREIKLEKAKKAEEQNNADVE